MHSYTITPHEFFYLVVNSTSRLVPIEKGHRINYKSEKLNVSSGAKHELENGDFSLHLLA